MLRASSSSDEEGENQFFMNAPPFISRMSQMDFNRTLQRTFLQAVDVDHEELQDLAAFPRGPSQTPVSFFFFCCCCLFVTRFVAKLLS